MRSELVKNSVGRVRAAPSVGQFDRRAKIADTLEALAIELRTHSDEEMATIPTESTLVALAAKVYTARRQIDTIFGMAGFAVSPAWDMMLDLYQAKVLGRRISVTSACIGGACPTTTGLRWLQVLESSHLVERKADPEDKRRYVIELTDGGRVKVERALACHL
ncbi:MAG: winged helix DNA-binding protein [Novosphingobium sp.]|jgi:hypothetical protein|uniref:winged helix DNA-binding protein n=1 Tax=Novosphingobium sp. TaxID=1874826 RepID=UPI003B9CDF0C